MKESGVIFVLYAVSNVVSALDGYNNQEYVEFGGDITLKCQRTIPFSTYSWYGIYGHQYSYGNSILEGLAENLRQRLTIHTTESEYNLNIRNVERYDQGQYICSSGNSSIDVYLHIKEPPVKVNLMTKKDNKVIADENSLTNITCNVTSGQPPSNISIFFDGRLLQHGVGTALTATLIPTRDDDLVNISCIANHPLLPEPLEDSALLYLNLTVSNMLFNSPSILYEGRHTRINCTTLGSRPPSRVNWYIDGELVNDSITVVESLEKPNETYKVESILNLDVKREYNKKEIACAVKRDTESDVIRKAQTMEIYYAPSVKVEKSDLEDEILLKCMPNGNPVVYTFLPWIHKSTINNEHIRNLTGSPDGILLLSLINKQKYYQNSGAYSCFVHNGVVDRQGNLIQNGSTSFVTRGKPTFSSDNKMEHSGQIGEDAIINAKFISWPAPNQPKWYNGPYSTGETITNSMKHTLFTTAAVITDTFINKNIHVNGFITTLTIKKMAITDFGNYTLQIGNQYGNITKKMQLRQIIDKTKEVKDENDSTIKTTGILLISVAGVVFLIVVALILYCRRRLTIDGILTERIDDFNQSSVSDSSNTFDRSRQSDVISTERIDDFNRSSVYDSSNTFDISRQSDGFNQSGVSDSNNTFDRSRQSDVSVCAQGSDPASGDDRYVPDIATSSKQTSVTSSEDPYSIYDFGSKDNRENGKQSQSSVHETTTEAHTQGDESYEVC